MRHIFISILIFISTIASAQSVAEAESLFTKKQYNKSLSIYESLLKRRPADVLLNYKAGRCAYELKNYFQAANYLEQAGSKYELTTYYLGQSYYYSYQFEKAVITLQEFIEGKSKDDEKKQEATELLTKAELGAKLINRIEDIAIIDSAIMNKADFLQLYKFNADLGSLNRAPIKIGSRTYDKITFTTQRDDRKIFSDTVNGKFNLFSSYKLMDEWSKPVSLSKTINTTANENYPFLLPDGITLYYASDGENSLGGYDIFMTKYSSSSKEYLSSENVGFPFNSSANDYMLVLDELQRTGWFATDRNQTSGKVAIYSFQINDPKKYYKSTDSVVTMQVAQLKHYRTIKPAKKIISSNKNKLNKPLKDLIVINDSVLYSSVDEFKGTKAKELYNEVLLMEKELTQLQKLIYDTRLELNDATNEQKITLTDKINQLEPTFIELKKTIEIKKKTAINEEIIFLQSNS